jgi:ferredoxin
VLDATERAASLQIIEEPFPEADARRQGARCLRCNINTVFDTSICIACNGCVDVCPQSIIKLVGLGQLARTDDGLAMVASTLGVPQEEVRGMKSGELDELGAIMLKDETTCIRCALCASRCPTHAINMKKFEFYRECVTVPTPNQKILYHPNQPPGERGPA